MKNYEHLEEYLFDYDRAGRTFSSREYAAKTNIAPAQASLNIQGYLRAQREPVRDADGNPISDKTIYLLRRVPGGRTSSARWAVGVRSRERWEIGQTFYEDVSCKLKRAMKPDLMRLEFKNPRAAAKVDRTIESVVEGAMVVLRNSLEAHEDD